MLALSDKTPCPKALPKALHGSLINRQAMILRVHLVLHMDDMPLALACLLSTKS
jgi:hypothetical protein